MISKSKIKKIDIGFAAGLFIGVIAVYFPAIHFSVGIFDDSSYVERLYLSNLGNLDIISYLFDPVLKLHSPFVMFSFLLDRILWGTERLALGLHLSNILYHAAGTVLLYFFCRKLIIPWPGSRNIFKLKLTPVWCAATAAVWAFHPQRVESVAWISERKDLLLSLFFFGILLCWEKSWKNKKFSYLAWVLFCLSFAVKPMLLMLPVIFWVWLIIKSGRYFCREHVQRLSPYILVSVVFAGVYFFFQQVHPFSADYGSFFLRSKIIVWNIGNYFFSALLPVHLMPFYPFYSPKYYSFLPALVFPGILCAAFLFGLKNIAIRTFFLPVLLLFPVALLPVCGSVRVGNADWADRYNLIPSLFLLFVIVFTLRWLCTKVQKTHLLIYLGYSFYILYLVMSTVNYLPCWRTLSAVKFACVTQVANPNYRIMFLHAMTAFLRNELQDAATIAEGIREDAVCTPYDKKMIRVFHAGFGGLLQSLGRDPDAGGKKLTELLLSDDIRYLALISEEFIDLAVGAAAYWNLYRKNISTAIDLYIRSAEYTCMPFSREIMLIKAALLKKDIGKAEKILFELENKSPHNPEIRSLKMQLNNLKK